AVGDLCGTANRFARLPNRSMLGRFDEALHPRIERGRSERAACACTAKVALRLFVFRGFLSATVFRDSFKLRMPVEFADALRAFTPVRNNFHEKAEKNFSIEKLFQFFARLGADFLQPFALMANQDFLL